MDEALKKDACDEDTPLMLRPFMAKAVGKLCRNLAVFLRRELLLTDVDDCHASRVFPVEP
jgi:hypothetical protein